MLHDAKERLHQGCENCRECVRESPGQALLAAVAAGYFLHRLPIKSLIVFKVRLIAALAPPALFAYGAAKVCEYLQNQARQSEPAPSPQPDTRVTSSGEFTG